MIDNFSNSQTVRKQVIATRGGVVAAQHRRAAEVGAAVGRVGRHKCSEIAGYNLARKNQDIGFLQSIQCPRVTVIRIRNNGCSRYAEILNRNGLSTVIELPVQHTAELIGRIVGEVDRHGNHSIVALGSTPGASTLRHHNFRNSERTK